VTGLRAAETGMAQLPKKKAPQGAALDALILE
jgi:hypothetical protein